MAASKTSKTKTKKVPEILKPASAAASAGRELLAAIWADPTDKNTLRVYADWLAEQGSKRGEYMQLRLLDAPSDSQQKAASKLLKDHRGEWLGAARPFVRSWSDSQSVPGFVSIMWCEAPKFIEGFDKILELGPWLSVVVTSMQKKKRETEAKMAALPLHKVYDLSLGSALDDKSIATLAPALKGIRALHLDGNNITPQGFETLGSIVDSIEYLMVRPEIALGGPERIARVNDIAKAILKTPGFRSLVHLHFFRCGSPSPALCRDLKKLPNLKKLNISEYTEWEGLRNLD